MNRSHSKILLATILGNTLEYYEFSILVVFAIQIGQAFFPDQSQFSQVLSTLGLFTAGFISRPFGSLIFGHIGDKFGRKRALIITIAGMSLTTLAIGFMPSHTHIGVLAPITLLILRLLQGIFIGGEGAGAAIFILEHELRFKRDVIGGILVSSNIAGIVIASLIGLLINKLIGLDSESWRFAFIVGGIGGMVISYMRTTIPETMKYNEMKPEEKIKIPAFKLFSKHWEQVLVVIAFGGFSAGVSYIVKGYIIIHFQQFMGFSADKAFIYLLFTSVLFTAFPPFLGTLSNRYTYRKFIFITTIIIILLFIPIFLLISTHHDAYIYIGLAVLAILAAAINTPMFLYFSDMFPTNLRYSGVAISFNLGITLVGGCTPIVSTALTNYTHLKFAPAFYIIALAIVYLTLDILLHKRISRQSF